MPDIPTYYWVEIQPGRRGGRPCIGHTRLTVEQFAALWWERQYDIENLQAGWPYIPNWPAQIKLCAWYLVRYNTPRWRKCWRDWYDTYEGRWTDSTTPLPPQEGDA